MTSQSITRNGASVLPRQISPLTTRLIPSWRMSGAASEIVAMYQPIVPGGSPKARRRCYGIHVSTLVTAVLISTKPRTVP